MKERDHQSSKYCKCTNKIRDQSQAAVAIEHLKKKSNILFVRTGSSRSPLPCPLFWPCSSSGCTPWPAPFRPSSTGARSDQGSKPNFGAQTFLKRRIVKRLATFLSPAGMSLTKLSKWMDKMLRKRPVFVAFVFTLVILIIPDYCS
jgi:hypothetical protein